VPERGFSAFERRFAKPVHEPKNGSGDAQRIYFAHVAQSVEHVLGKDEVISSILIMGSILEGMQ
jgi:hypothetical protein